MHKDDLSTTREHEVRFAWKPSVMKDVSIPQGMHKPADLHFRLGINTPDRGHVPATLFPTVDVHD